MQVFINSLSYFVIFVVSLHHISPRCIYLLDMSRNSLARMLLENIVLDGLLIPEAEYAKIFKNVFEMVGDEEKISNGLLVKKVEYRTNSLNLKIQQKSKIFNLGLLYQILIIVLIQTF